MSVTDPNTTETYGGIGVEVPLIGLPDPVQSGIAAADRLQAILDRAGSWPVWAADPIGGMTSGTYSHVGSYGGSARDLALFAAFRESDRQRIQELTHWDKDRPLHVDPLPQRIAEAYSSLLFSETPDFYSESDADQDKMNDMVEDTGLAEQLVEWTERMVSEGETWWRAWTDTNVSEWPLISGHSRLNVIPLYVGRKIAAAAFVDTILQQTITSEHQTTTVFYRHVEIQATGYVRNLLYKGTVAGLGNRIPLDTLPETEDLEEDWVHKLPFMLAGRIVNKFGRDFRLGVSDFNGVRDLLMDLNEARTIMAENARLVLKARMVVPASAVNQNGEFDASKDIILEESLDEALDGKNARSYAVLEYNFRANELIQHKDELVQDIMARCGLAEQFSGGSSRSSGSGQAFTGTALRTRLIPTIQAGASKAKQVDKEVPIIQRRLAMLSALPPEQGGCGQSWSKADGKHYYQRSEILPEDINEKVQRHVMAVQGEVESIESAVRDMHPDWTDEEVEEEIERITDDHSSGPVYLDPNMHPDDPNAPGNVNDPNVPNLPPGGPGSHVPSPADVVGSQQPGSGRTPDGQSPGQQAPRVTAGGPR